MALIRASPAHRDAQALAQGEVGWHRHMGIFDAQLQRTGAYAAGADFTLADVVLGLSTQRWMATPMARPPLPAVAAYDERLSARPAFCSTGATASRNRCAAARLPPRKRRPQRRYLGISGRCAWPSKSALCVLVWVIPVCQALRRRQAAAGQRGKTALRATRCPCRQRPRRLVAPPPRPPRPRPQGLRPSPAARPRRLRPHQETAMDPDPHPRGAIATLPPALSFSRLPGPFPETSACPPG